MSCAVWDRDMFGSSLTASLVDILKADCSAQALARVVAECAVAADAVCCNRPMNCSAGCPHCCVLNVAILLPEGMIIAKWLRERLPSSKLARVSESLANHNLWGRWMEDEERISRLATCPLLDDEGNCSIHPVRPLACRGVASLDRNSCREAFNPIISDQERLVPADLLRRAAFDEAFKSLAQALRHHGMDDRSIELGAGVMAFLDRSGCREQLLSGELLPRELWD